MYRDRRSEIATHEAGHAVVARHLGFEVAEVVADWDEGRTSLPASWVFADPSDRILVLLAGRAAEHLSYGPLVLPAWNDQQRAEEAAREILGECSRGELDRYLASAFTSVCDLLADNEELWRELNELSIELLWAPVGVPVTSWPGDGRGVLTEEVAP